jgi:L-ascorbate metabolism protein UlaG (beta-lactamase superfamily)
LPKGPWRDGVETHLGLGDASPMNVTFLGQSGFVLRTPGSAVVLDPFLGPLEDEGERTRFRRLVEPPATPDSLGTVDVVLVSRHHGDHCHAATLKAIADHSPECRFVVTPSARDILERRGFPASRILVPWLPGWVEFGNVRAFVVPARHYEFSYRDDAVFDYFGFVLEMGGRRVYSAGDTIPYAGLYSLVASLRPDIGLLPVNGRDVMREGQGIIGNLTPDECVEFTRVCGWSWMVPCHFGMFESNTADIENVARLLREGSPETRVWVPSLGETRDLS